MNIALKLTVVAAALVAGSAIAAADTSAGKTTRIEAGKAVNTLLAREGSSGGHRQRRGGEGGAASDAPASADQLAREGGSGGNRQRRSGTA